MIVSSLAWWRAHHSHGIRWQTPSWNAIQSRFKDSLEFFLSRLAVALTLNSNVILVGLLFSETSAGEFSAAEKCLYAITTLYVPLIEAIYPYMARTKNVRLIRKIIGYTTALNAMACSVAYWLAPWVIPLIFGSEFTSSITLYRWMLVVACLHLPTSLIGYPVLAALGHANIANRSIMIAAIAHIALLTLLIPIASSPIQVVWVMIASQCIVLSQRVWHLVRQNILQRS